MLVPTESEALRVDADGRELPYVRITLQGLTAEV